MKYIKKAALSIVLAGTASIALAGNYESDNLVEKDYSLGLDRAALETKIENIQANAERVLSDREILKELGVSYTSPTSDPRYSAWDADDFREQMID